MSTAARTRKKRSQPPEPRDFSQEAVRQAVLREGLTHPLTLYLPALGVLGGLAGVLFASPGLLAAAIGTGVIGLGSGVVNVFFRRDALAGRYLQRLNDRQAAHEKQVLVWLRNDLRAGLRIPATRVHARRGLEQFERCRPKFRNVEELLGIKLNQSELTYGRFLSAARQVYLSVLDNLGAVAALLKSAGTIDADYIASRLKALEVKSPPSDSDRQEMDALVERQRLLEAQLAAVDERLAGNESAMTRLEETTSRLAALDTGARFAQTDFETAIAYMQELAQNTQQYNPPPTAIEVEKVQP